MKCDPDLLCDPDPDLKCDPDPDLPFYYCTGSNDTYNDGLIASFNVPSSTGERMSGLCISRRADPGVIGLTLYCILHSSNFVVLHINNKMQLFKLQMFFCCTTDNVYIL